MSKHTYVCLTDIERQELEQLIRTGNASARTHAHARILLLCDRSQGQRRIDAQVAEAVLCSTGTVFNVRKRFLTEGLHSALHAKSGGGAVPKITGEVEAKLVMLACSAPPEGHKQWTLRLLGDSLIELGLLESITEAAICKRLKKLS
jgi:putative transposase